LPFHSFIYTYRNAKRRERERWCGDDKMKIKMMRKERMKEKKLGMS
jgi:hypothetical protein